MKFIHLTIFAIFLGLLSACADTPFKQNSANQDKALESVKRGSTLLSNVSFDQVMALNTTMFDEGSDSSIQLAYGNSPLQYGRLYLPKVSDADGDQHKAPLVIFIHGGCWLNAYNIKHSAAFSQSLAQQGFAVWSLEYRRTGDAGGGWPGSLNDVLKGVSFAQSFRDYPIDLKNIVLVGHSAGGHLALLASSPQRNLFKGDERVKGVIGLAAIVDVVNYSKGQNSCQTATSAFFGGDTEQKQNAYRLGSPLSYPLPENTLLLQGDADTIVEIGQASNSGLTYKIVAGAGHFDWIHPQTNAYQVFLSALENRVSNP
ncbi:alpha/beta hydrolase [uncultured Paraglaciecola sp.]|uniref:alpha/beta hydrolase family protein n=1 Tax=uncultured Paraglaciecola sp. TaxID=1765024 RepID=UPI0030DCACE9|tara:strand:+ start:1119 stop:2063 length:945 start_codon:yes stop_codon:yes gene_type:complete